MAAKRDLTDLHLLCVYLLPSQSDMDSIYDYVYNCYDKLCLGSPNSGFIVAGDFKPISTEFQSKRLKIHYNIYQVVKKPTRKNNILDLNFTNIAQFYLRPDTLAPLFTSDHNVVIWKSKNPYQDIKKGKTMKVKVREIKPTNINGFGFFMQNLDWCQVLGNIGIDE